MKRRERKKHYPQASEFQGIEMAQRFIQPLYRQKSPRKAKHVAPSIKTCFRWITHQEWTIGKLYNSMTNQICMAISFRLNTSPQFMQKACFWTKFMWKHMKSMKATNCHTNNYDFCIPKNLWSSINTMVSNHTTNSAVWNIEEVYY